MPTTASNSPTPYSRHRFHLLDGLRGLAAAFVVLWHLPACFNSRQFAPNAFLAVDFFCCLSGFIIAFSYQHRLQSSLRWRQFLLIRLIRLYPLHLLGLAFGVVALASVIGLHNLSTDRLELLRVLLLNGTFLPLIDPAHSAYAFPLNDPAWSLFAELVANVLFAAMVALRRSSATAWLVIAALSLLTLLGQGKNIDVGWAYGTQQIELGLARVLLSFSLGVLLYQLSQAMAPPQLPGPLAAPLLGVCLAVLFIAPFAWMRSTWAHLTLVIMAIPAIVFLSASVPISAPLRTLCNASGELSYPIYLLHWPLLRMLDQPATQRLAQHSSIAAGVLCATFFFILIAIGYAVRHLYDEPVRRFLTRTLLRPPVPSTLAAT